MHMQQISVQLPLAHQIGLELDLHTRFNIQVDDVYPATRADEKTLIFVISPEQQGIFEQLVTFFEQQKTAGIISAVGIIPWQEKEDEDSEELSEQVTHCHWCSSVITKHEVESNDGLCNACDSSYEHQLHERERREEYRAEVVGYAQVMGRFLDAEELTFFACTIPFRDAWTGVDFVTITRNAWEDPTSVFYHAPCEVCRRVHW